MPAIDIYVASLPYVLQPLGRATHTPKKKYFSLAHLTVSLSYSLSLEIDSSHHHHTPPSRHMFWSPSSMFLAYFMPPLNTYLPVLGSSGILAAHA